MSAALYDVYDALRAESPVLWNESSRTWMLFRYSDVASALRNPALSSGARVEEMRREFALVLPDDRAERAAQVFARQLETRDPPGHTGVRQAFSPCFHGVVARLRPAVCTLVDELNRAHGWRFPLDLVPALARPLPLQVVLEALGVERAARPGFGEDVASFLRHLSDPAVDGAQALDRLRREVRAASAGILAGVAQQENAIEEDDVIANAILIVSAGHRTTANLIGSLLLSLLDNRPSLELLMGDPALIPAAVEEVLRMESPIQALQRTATSATTAGGVEIAKGQSVTLVVGAANRDPEEFPAPARFDLHRSPNRHLAFGFGVHFCLGAALARMQAAVVLESLVPRLAELRVQSAVWHEDTESRGLARLVVERS